LRLNASALPKGASKLLGAIGPLDVAVAVAHAVPSILSLFTAHRTVTIGYRGERQVGCGGAGETAPCVRIVCRWRILPTTNRGAR
jgi:hypothetical protein